MELMEIGGREERTTEQKGQQNTPNTFSATRVALTFSGHGGASFVALHFTDPVFAFLVVLVVVRNMKSKVSPRVEERERESSDSNTSNSSSSNNGTSSLSLPSLGVIFPKSNASAAALTSFLYLASGAW
jgi:hypothetical protein